MRQLCLALDGEQNVRLGTNSAGEQIYELAQAVGGGGDSWHGHGDRDSAWLWCAAPQLRKFQLKRIINIS